MPQLYCFIFLIKTSWHIWHLKLVCLKNDGNADEPLHAWCSIAAWWFLDICRQRVLQSLLRKAKENSQVSFDSTELLAKPQSQIANLGFCKTQIAQTWHMTHTEILAVSMSRFSTWTALSPTTLSNVKTKCKFHGLQIIIFKIVIR